MAPLGGAFCGHGCEVFSLRSGPGGCCGVPARHSNTVKSLRVLTSTTLQALFTQSHPKAQPCSRPQ